MMFAHPHAVFMNRNHSFAVRPPLFNLPPSPKNDIDVVSPCKILAGLAKGCDATADIIATIAMCLFLTSAHTGISRCVPLPRPLTSRIYLFIHDRRTSSLLRSLMHLVINRGLLVTAAQIILLITFFASVGHLYWCVCVTLSPPRLACLRSRHDRLAVHVRPPFPKTAR